MHTTIKDLAGATGLNISSISRSLKGQAGVSGETRKRVLQVVQRLGYRRNSLASGLITRRTRGVEDAAHQAGYEVVLGNSDLDPDKGQRYSRRVRVQHLAGHRPDFLRHHGLHRNQCQRAHAAL